MTEAAKLLRFARQSERRVASGLRLVALGAATALVAALIDVPWLVKLALAVTAFFLLTSLAEWLNARLKRRKACQTREERDT
jgi:predicted PurR-regulated permease PerM